MASAFSRLVRFKASGGHVFYGDAGDDWETSLEGRTVPVFTGLDPWDSKFQISGKTTVIEEASIQNNLVVKRRGLTHLQVLCPLETVPIVLGIGLNYRGHALEAGVSLLNTT